MFKLLKKIVESDYENVFSWTIKERTGEFRSHLIDFLDSIQQKCDAFADAKDVFNVKRFHYQLIAVYELYILGSSDKALQEIQIIVESIDLCKFDETNYQYSVAYQHIARSTFAYIALSMHCYTKKIMETVKPINIMSRAEKSAICAVKACVFIEYSPNGNDFALKFASEARSLYSDEPQWIDIWLKAKGRVRRFYNMGKSMPDECEVEAADMLCSQTNPKPHFLITACNTYHDVATYYMLHYNKEKSRMYFKRGADLLIVASKLINDDIKDLSFCLITCLFTPKKYQSQAIINQIVEKLKTSNSNPFVYDVLGEYYSKYEKDYDKAKMYFSRGMYSGQFRCAMQLLRIDCRLKSVDIIQLIQKLKMIYDIFPSPRLRLIVLAQMLFCYYDAENPKELLQSLKLYLDLAIEDVLKTQALFNISPIIKSRKEVQPGKFFNVLIHYVNYIRIHNEWNAEERIVFEDTCTLFNTLYNSRQTNVNSTKNFHQQISYECVSEKTDHSSNSKLLSNRTRSYKTEWHKKQDNDLEATLCNIIAGGEDKYEKLRSVQKETIKYQKEEPKAIINKSLTDDFNKYINICDSSEIDEEPNRWKNLNLFIKNVHIPDSNKDTLMKSVAYGTEIDKFDGKNKHQIDKLEHDDKIDIQEQEKKSSLPNNSNVPSPPEDTRVRIKNLNWYNNSDIISKNKHKLDWRFQRDRNVCDQSKRH